MNVLSRTVLDMLPPMYTAAIRIHASTSMIQPLIGVAAKKCDPRGSELTALEAGADVIKNDQVATSDE